MSCYLRHLSDLFVEAGLEYSKANRKSVDRSTRAELGMESEGCPLVWKTVKAMLHDPAGRSRLEDLIREVSNR